MLFIEVRTGETETIGCGVKNVGRKIIDRILPRTNRPIMRVITR